MLCIAFPCLWVACSPLKLERQTGVEPAMLCIAFPCLLGRVFELSIPKKVMATIDMATINFFESGKRDSNPRPLAWEANALPTELLPRCCFCLRRYNFYFKVGCCFAIFSTRTTILLYFGNASPRSSTSTAFSTVESLRLMNLTCSHIPSSW